MKGMLTDNIDDPYIPSKLADIAGAATERIEEEIKKSWIDLIQLAQNFVNNHLPKDQAQILIKYITLEHAINVDLERKGYNIEFIIDEQPELARIKIGFETLCSPRLKYYWFDGSWCETGSLDKVLKEAKEVADEERGIVSTTRPDFPQLKELPDIDTVPVRTTLYRPTLADKIKRMFLKK